MGAEDRNPADLPRQWDPYLGNTRVARAESMSAQFAALGVPVQLNVFPGVGHALTDEIGTRAMDFIAARGPSGGRALIVEDSDAPTGRWIVPCAYPTVELKAQVERMLALV